MRCEHLSNLNAISGLPMDEPNDGRKHDYIVVRQREWIDGFCVSPGAVCQFVAMPFESVKVLVAEWMSNRIRMYEWC